MTALSGGKTAGAVLLAMCLITPGASGQPGGVVIDVARVPNTFAALFEGTCFRHRHAPLAVRHIADARGWLRLPGPFPFRNEAERSTTLDGWSFLHEGLPFQLTLSVWDHSSPVVQCHIMSAVLLHEHKSALPTALLKIEGLESLGRVPHDEQDITAFTLQSEPNLRLFCASSTVPQVPVGQCGLSIVTGAPTPE